MPVQALTETEPGGGHLQRRGFRKEQAPPHLLCSLGLGHHGPPATALAHRARECAHSVPCGFLPPLLPSPRRLSASLSEPAGPVCRAPGAGGRRSGNKELPPRSNLSPEGALLTERDRPAQGLWTHFPVKASKPAVPPEWQECPQRPHCGGGRGRAVSSLRTSPLAAPPPWQDTRGSRGPAPTQAAASAPRSQGT